MKPHIVSLFETAARCHTTVVVADDIDFSMHVLRFASVNLSETVLAHLFTYSITRVYLGSYVLLKNCGK